MKLQKIFISVILIRDNRKLSHRVICRVSGGEYAHAALGFHYPHSPARDFFVECLSSKTLHADHSGISPQRPLSELRSYAYAHAAHVSAVYFPLSVYPGEIQQTLNKISSARPLVRYASLQLLSNWLSCRTGVYLSRRSPTETRWHCAEFCVRVLPRRIAYDTFKTGVFRFDEYIPSGPHPSSMLRLLTLAGYASYPIAPPPLRVISGQS